MVSSSQWMAPPAVPATDGSSEPHRLGRWHSHAESANQVLALAPPECKQLHLGPKQNLRERSGRDVTAGCSRIRLTTSGGPSAVCPTGPARSPSPAGTEVDVYYEAFVLLWSFRRERPGAR